jgi:hypothetical protein
MVRSALWARVSRTMLRIARRTMRPDCGLILRDAAKTPLLKDEAIESAAAD